MTFNEIKEEYLQFKEKTEGVKKSTLGVICQQYKTYITPMLGDTNIEDFRTRHMQQFADELLKKGSLSVKTIRELVMRVTNIIGYVQWKYEIPCYKFRVIYPSEEKPIPFDYEKTFTPDEIRRILLTIIKNPSHLNMCIALMLFTGCRIGELCALRWENYKEKENVMQIESTLERVYDGEKTSIIIQSAKTTSSRREVPLPMFLSDWLQNRKSTNMPTWFIVTESFKPTEPRTLRNNYYKILDAAGVRRLSPHKMRHTFATNLIQSGADIKTVSALLGHSDTNVTLDIYTHIDINKKRKTIDAIFGKNNIRKKEKKTMLSLQAVLEKDLEATILNN